MKFNIKYFLVSILIFIAEILIATTFKNIFLFFQLDDPVLENIRKELTKIDINTLTPIEALMNLNSIRK